MLSALDVKGAFNNVPIDPASRKYCGIITQDGVWEYCKMTFGFNTAPAHFQQVIVDALETDGVGVPPPPHATYMDDCTTGAGGARDEGELLRVAWGHTLAAMWRLALHGLPINLSKCHLLCRQLNLLGVVLFERRYQLGRKSLQKLIASKLPQMLRQLRAVAGRLEHVGKFLPDYSRLVKPIRALLRKNGGDWREQHAEALNALAELVYRRL